MPNWCTNDLTIVGKPKMLNKLLKQVATTESEAGDEATPFDFNKVIPEPPNVDWYGWRIEHWGTKWNASDVMFVSDNGFTEELTDDCWEHGEVIITFQTAWSPPVPVLEKLSKDNPQVKIIHKFYETGAGFYGTYEYSKGMITVEEQGEFDKGTSCETYQNYFGDSYHHYCDECHENFDCDGEPQDLCVECQEKLEDMDKELWEEEQSDEVETSLKEAHSVA